LYLLRTYGLNFATKRSCFIFGVLFHYCEFIITKRPCHLIHKLHDFIVDLIHGFIVHIIGNLGYSVHYNPWTQLLLHWLLKGQFLYLVYNHVLSRIGVALCIFRTVSDNTAVADYQSVCFFNFRHCRKLAGYVCGLFPHNGITLRCRVFWPGLAAGDPIMFPPKRPLLSAPLFSSEKIVICTVVVSRVHIHVQKSVGVAVRVVNCCVFCLVVRFP